MTFLDRVRAWLDKRLPEPTGADLERLRAEQYRRAGEAFQEEMARRVASGNVAYFPGDSDQPRQAEQEGWISWG